MQSKPLTKTESEADHLLSTILETSNSLILVLDRQGRIVRFNRACEQLTGYAAAEVLGRRFWDFLLLPEEVEPVKAVFSELLENPASSHENYWVAKNGERHLIAWSNTALVDDEGNVEHVIGIGLDLTERKRTEEALRKSEQRLQMAVGAIGGGVYEHTFPLDETLYFSPKWAELLGYHPEELPPFHRFMDWFLEQVHPDDVNVFGTTYRAFIAGKSPNYEVEVRLRHRQGHWVWVQVYSLALERDENERATRLVGLMRDISDRKQAQEALRESEAEARRRLARIEAIYRSAPIGLCELDTDLRYVRINERLAEVNGIPAEEHIGRTIHQIIPSLVPEAEPLFQHVLESGEPILDVEISGETAAHPGVERVWNESYVPIKETSGQVVGVNVVVEEITERKQAEAHLARLAAIIESSQDAITRQSLDHIITDWNASAERMYGYTTAEAVGQSIELIVSPECWEEMDELAARVKRGEAVQGYETVRRTRGGGRVPVALTMSPIYDGDGRVVALSTIERDISERKRAEEALRESEARLDSIIRNATDAIITLDDDQHVVLFNTAAEQIFGYRAEDVLGRSLEMLIPERLHPAHGEHVRRSGQEGGTACSMAASGEFLGLRANGEEFPIEVTISQVEISGQKLYTAILRDITERKAAEAAIRQLNQELEQRVADRTRELSILYDLSSLAAESLDLDATLRKALPQVAEAIRCNGVAVQLLDPTEGTLTLIGQQGLPAGLIAQLAATAAGAGSAGWVLAHHQPLILSDLATDGWGADLVQVQNLRTYAGVPMRAQGDTIGVLSVYAGQERQLQVEEIGLLISIADRLAVTLRNIQLFAQTQQHVQQLAALYRADRELHRHLDLDQVLQALLDVVVDIGGAANSSLLVWDDAQEKLVVRAARHLSQEAIQAASFAAGEGLAGRVMVNGEPLLVENVHTDARVSRPDLLEAAGMRALGCIPLKIEGEIFGVFSVGYAHPRRVRLEEWRFFTALAQRATLAIKNAQLYEQAQRAAILEERQRLARELHDSVTQSLFGLMVFAESGGQLAPTQTAEQATAYWREAREMAQQTLKEMRLLVHELRPSALRTAGLVGALQQRLDTVEKRAGMRTTLLADCLPALPPAVEEGLYRIAQEALNNALKHALATEVTVRLVAEGGRVTLMVMDNGRGFDPEATCDSGGMGLANIQQRAARLGGAAVIHSMPGAGTRVETTVPAAPDIREEGP
jgi:PAS domain S-box-containing protein